MGLTPDDDAVLRSMGVSFLHNYSIQTTMFIMYGICICLFPYAITIVFRKAAKTRFTYVLLTSMLLLLFSVTMVIGSHITITSTQYHEYLANPRVTLGSRKTYFRQRYIPAYAVNLASCSIAVIIGDAIVTWRAWVLYPSNAIAKAVLLFTVSANTLLNLVYTASYCIDILAPRNIPLNAASTYLSAVTNLVATILIAIRVWQYRKGLNTMNIQKRTRVETTLLLLVETGSAFAFVQFVNAILTQFTFETGSALDLALGSIASVMVFSAAIFPTLLVIVMHRENTSILDRTIKIGQDAEGAGDSGERAVGYLSTLRFKSTPHTATSGTYGAGSSDEESLSAVGSGSGELTSKTEV